MSIGRSNRDSAPVLARSIAICMEMPASNAGQSEALKLDGMRWFTRATERKGMIIWLVNLASARGEPLAVCVCVRVFRPCEHRPAVQLCGQATKPLESGQSRREMILFPRNYLRQNLLMPGCIGPAPKMCAAQPLSFCSFGGEQGNKRCNNESVDEDAK